MQLGEPRGGEFGRDVVLEQGPPIVGCHRPPCGTGPQRCPFRKLLEATPTPQIDDLVRHVLLKVPRPFTPRIRGDLPSEGPIIVCRHRGNSGWIPGEFGVVEVRGGRGGSEDKSPAEGEVAGDTA